MKMRIKRCPFCNGRTHIQHCVYDFEEYGNMIHGYYIECRDCDASGPYSCIENYTQSSDESYTEFHNRVKRDCIQKWNESIVKFGIVNKSVNYEDSTLSPGAENATEKQLKFANAIANRLNIKLPIEKSKYNIRAFISENINEFNKKTPKYDRGYGDWEEDYYPAEYY